MEITEMHRKNSKINLDKYGGPEKVAGLLLMQTQLAQLKINSEKLVFHLSNTNKEQKIEIYKKNKDLIDMLNLLEKNKILEKDSELAAIKFKIDILLDL
jgi:hypothetical protein